MPVSRSGSAGAAASVMLPLLAAVVAQVMRRVVVFAGYLGRFAARLSGRAFGLARANGPPGRQRSPRP
jgi:hypothetical protein